MAAVTANVNASTRWDPSHATIAQLGMSTTEQRAAKKKVCVSVCVCVCVCVYLHVVGELMYGACSSRE